MISKQLSLSHMGLAGVFPGRNRRDVIRLDIACLKGVDFLTPLSSESTGVYSVRRQIPCPCAQNLKGTLGIVTPLLFSFLSGAMTGG